MDVQGALDDDGWDIHNERSRTGARLRRLRAWLLALFACGCGLDYHTEMPNAWAAEPVSPCVEDETTRWLLCSTARTHDEARRACEGVGYTLAAPVNPADVREVTTALWPLLSDDVGELGGRAWTGWPVEADWPGCSAFLDKGLAVPMPCSTRLPYVCQP